MPTYEVEVNGQKYEIDAPDDNAVQIAVRQLQGVGKPQGRHLSYEEGAALLDQEQRDQSANSGMGQAGAGMSGFVNDIPIAGPYILSGIQKAAAGISSIIDGESYDTNLKQAQQTTEDAQAANPTTRMIGGIAGSVAGTAPLVAAAPAAFGIGAASLPARMLAAGSSGAAIGGADAAVRSDADPYETAKGAVIGGGLGIAGPAVGDLAGRGYRAVMGNRATAEAARMAGTSKPAVDVVARSLGADDAANAVNTNIASAGPRAMLADAGPSTMSVLDTAIQRAGPGAGRAAERITQRAAGATDDITNALDNALGQPQGMVNPLDELRSATQPARKAAYDAAYSTPISYADPRGQALEKIVKTRVPGSVINKANNLMRVEGAQSKQILAKIAEDGTVTFEQLPDVQQLDYITRALNDVSKAGDGAGALGGNTAEGRAYGGLSKTIRDLTKDLVPEYKVALDTAAEPIAAREAMLFGQQMLSKGVARDEVEAFVSGLSKAELDSVKGGVRATIAENLANVKRAVSDPNIDARQGIAALRDLSSDAAREKLTAVVGKTEADAMFRAIDQASKSFELRAGVASNSRTYARQAAERAVGQATAPSILETAASGSPIKTVQGALRGFMGTSDADMLARQDATWSEIADLLTQPAGRAGGTFLQALQGAAGRLPVIDRQAAGLARGVTGGVALSSAPARRLAETSR